MFYANVTSEWKQAYKGLKTISKQNRCGKSTEVAEVIQKVALVFAGPFWITRYSERFLLVSIDDNTEGPDAKFLQKKL